VLLSPINQHWLDNFRIRHGHSPRILHIGNIANNAYNNARLLNEAGLDCDVICYNYYHVMACPEWEDADFSGHWGSDFRPNWSVAGLTNFSRPRWFAQGSAQLCIKYLLSNRRGEKSKAECLWSALILQNRAASIWAIPFRYLFPGLGILVLAALERAKWRFHRFADGHRVSSRIARNCDSGRVATRVKGELARMLTAIGLLVAAVGVRVFLSVVSRGAIRNLRLRFDRRVSELHDSYAKEFPERSDSLLTEDFPPSLSQEPWGELFAEYDYIVAYSTDPIVPMTVEVPYFAFEHGTIRDIPYDATSQGRLTALAYRLARHVFVTNFDCRDSAENLAPGRYSIINHPYDEDHGFSVSGWEIQRNELFSVLDCEFIFFHPTRQDWVSGTGYADKSNDVFLRAFIALRSEGLRVGLVCCSWGSNVEQSKSLLNEYGCSKNVRWVAPMAIIPFERMCLATSIVVDQFKLGSFGGVTFKAMAVGAPILTFLDEQRLSRQYSECPPVLNCRTTEEIITKARSLISSPDQLARMGNASRAWMKKFHGKDMTVNAQVDQFRSHSTISDACATTQ
jgi:hypothetical protein